MKITYKNIEKNLIIIKTSNEELKKIKNKKIFGYIFISLFNLYFWGKLIYEGNILIAFITYILMELLFAGFIGGFYNQIKYKYCDEILILSHDNIEIKYVLEDKLLYSKKIDYDKIIRIYTKVDHRNPYLRGGTKKADNIVLSEYFENIRSLKIKVSSNEIYTWGSEVKEQEIYEILLVINDYIKNIKEEKIKC